jgi:CMP/dCMP kinase
MTRQPFVITISHQLGSGGAYLGQKLSERLGFPFFDREIIKKVAEELHLAESQLQDREERLSTFWETMGRNALLSDPVGCLTLDSYEPTDQELFDHEAEVIAQIAGRNSAIFLGRCGNFILRKHPARFSILVHASLPDRVKRLRDLYCLEEEAAKKIVSMNDRERNAYIRAFTREDWLDVRLYDLAMNTTSLGLDKAVDLALACVEEKIPQVS